MEQELNLSYQSRLTKLTLGDFATQKVLLAITGLLTLFQGLTIWVHSSTVPASNLTSLLGTIGGIVLITTSFLVKSERKVIFLERTVLLLLIILFSLWVFAAIYTNPSYGTDELAFDQYAAQLFVSGKDPYIMSMNPSLDLYQVPAIFHSYDLTGKAVDQLSYPAMSFLLYVPALLAGIQTQAAVYVDCLFWIITIVMMYALLPRPYKLVSVIIGYGVLYQSYAVGGVTDFLFMPFMLLGAWKWDKYGDDWEKSAARWVGPIAMGIACSVKQTPWFVMPFLFLAIYSENKYKENGNKVFIRYIGVFLLSFLVPNLPFLVWHPVSWISGIFTPFIHSLIPDGQGVVNLTIFEKLGGGNLTLYSVVGALFVLGLLAYQYSNNSLMKPILFILPSIIFLFPTRSFASYLINLFPAFLLSVLTITKLDDHEVMITRWYNKRYVQYLYFAPALIALIAALSVSSPLQMNIKGFHTTGQLGTIDSLTVQVKNKTDQVVEPNFTTTTTNVTTFWNKLKGPDKLQPHQSATYVLTAPNYDSMPSILGGFMVDAFTVKPATISTTEVYKPNTLHTQIIPQAVNEIVPLSSSVTLHVKIYDNLGNEVKRAGVRIYLGQVIYEQNTLLVGESSINGNPIGKSPVSSITDANGEAVFSIAAQQAQKNPIYYQAFLQDNIKSYPYGYSRTITIRFQ